MFFTLYALVAVFASVGLEYWVSLLTESDLFYSFFHEFPMFGLVPLLSILVAFWFFYLASVAKSNLSKRFNLALVSSFVLPLMTVVLSWFWMGQFISVVKEIHVTRLPINLFVSYVVPGLYLLTLVVSFLTALLLIRNKDKFLKEEGKSSDVSKRWIMAFFVFLVVPIIGLVSFSYIKTQEKDFHYSTIQSKVNFHVYRPNPSMMGGLENRVYYEIVDGDEGEEVQSGYGFPILHSLAAAPYGHYIYMAQRGVDDSFDLDSYTQKIIEDDKSGTVEKIDSSNVNIDIAKKIAIIHTKDGDIESYLIEMVTDDNVLITISGVWLNAPQDEPLLDELVEFANSLY